MDNIQQDVQVESSTTTEGTQQSVQQSDTNFDDLFADDVNVGEPSTPKTEQAQEPVKSETPNPENPGFKKRIDQLTAKRKEAEQRASKLEFEKSKLEAAYKMLEEQFSSKMESLSKYETEDPVASELEQYKLQQKVLEVQKQLEADYQNKIQQFEYQSKVEMFKEQLSAEVDSAVTKYPTVSANELLSYISKHPDQDIQVVAKQIHDARYSVLEKQILEKHKMSLQPTIRPSAPTAGQKHSRTIKSNEDLIAELDSEFGADWNKR